MHIKRLIALSVFIALFSACNEDKSSDEPKKDIAEQVKKEKTQSQRGITVTCINDYFHKRHNKNQYHNGGPYHHVCANGEMCDGCS